MSQLTHDSFSEVPGCIGPDAYSIMQCIIEVHSSKEKWTSLRKKGLDFIKETHNRKTLLKEWSKVINSSLALANKRNEVFLTAETAYGQRYPHLLPGKNYAGSGFGSFLEHYIQKGKEEGKTYSHVDELLNGLVNDSMAYKEPTELCPQGERIYLKMYKDVADGWIGSAFDHYINHGNREGRIYACQPTISILDKNWHFNSTSTYEEHS